MPLQAKEGLCWSKQIKNLLLTIILKLLFQDYFFSYLHVAQISFSYLALQLRVKYM